jgi:hypothetical protein
MARPRIPPAKRFWAKVQKTDSCWLWTSGTARYGQFTIQTTKLAHRVAWELTHGKIPKGLQVLHHCDNQRCVRPDHLFLGTQQDNMDDMKTKGRGRWRVGSRHGMAKLTDADVLAIRTRYATGKVLQQTLANEYGVWQGAISRIIRRTGWRHI